MIATPRGHGIQQVAGGQTTDAEPAAAAELPAAMRLAVIQERMKQSREAKGLDLEELSRRTGVRTSVLQAIDRGDFASLPRGLYGRSAVRAYAAAVGMDGDAVLQRVLPLLSQMEDPLDGLARVRGIARRPRVEPPQSTPPLRTEKGDEEPSTGRWRRQAAVVIDGALLGGIDIALIGLTAVACGTSIGHAARAASPALGLLFVVIAAIYFLLLGGIRNATVGMRMMGILVCEEADGSVDARAVVARARLCLLRETSACVDWLIRSDNGQRWVRALRGI